MNYDEPEAADEPEASNIPEEKQQPTTFKVKTTINKNTENRQIPPSEIGIQLLRELLEDAKNKQKLSTDDASAYTALYNEWRTAKGKPELKKAKLVSLRKIYERVLYIKK